MSCQTLQSVWVMVSMYIKPQTEEEKACFQVIHDLDHVGKHVEGSITNKKI